MAEKRIWHRVLEDANELHEGRVMSVTAGHKGVCLARHEGKLCALDNKCPHQGGPLGEGSIENGWLRCPWHGWDFHPCTGRSPGSHEDGVPTYDVEERDGSIFVSLPPEEEATRSISDVMVETMVNWGVNTVFGMVGHSNLGFADAMRRAEARGDLRYFTIRHEGAGAFAASAYGKLTGKPAACFSIAGPGATNMYTGLWDAKVDRAPILALTGQVATQVVGTGNFQEIDLVRAFQTVADFNQRVHASSQHAELMSLAIKHALLNRDVSHLTFPDEVQTVPADDAQASTAAGRITPTNIAPPAQMLAQAVKMIHEAERPMIVVGHGARFDMEAVIELAELLACPVVTTFKGKGQIADSHPLAGGVLGRSGTPIASWFMNEADLLIVFGASFSNHTGITSKLPTIQVDFDPLALSKFHAVDCALWGSIDMTVAALRSELGNRVATTDQRVEIAQRWEIWRAEKQKRLMEVSDKGLSSIAVFEAMNRHCPDNAVMCVDVGNNAYSFGRYYESKPGTRFLMSGYLGSIGFAFPAAIGACAAVGDTRPVIAVAGDGGFTQYLGDFTTAVKYDMPIKLVLLNNGQLGKISKEQRAGEFDVWKTDLHNPNYSEFATSCGGLGIRAETADELNEALQKLMAHSGPGLLEVMTDALLI